MSKLKFVLIFLPILLTYSCAPEEHVTEAKQYTWINVYARYLASDQAYKTEATFLKGDSLATALPTKIEGTVTIGNQSMTAHQLSADIIRYQADYKGTFVKDLTIQVKDESIPKAPFQMEFLEVPPFEVKDQKISISEGGEILLAKAVILQASEELIIMLNDPKKQTARITITGPGNLQSISIAPEQLKVLQNTGKGNLYLLSKRHRDFPDAFWSYILEYYSTETPINIME